jgi:hypothetical protein
MSKLKFSSWNLWLIFHNIFFVNTIFLSHKSIIRPFLFTFLNSKKTFWYARMRKRFPLSCLTLSRSITMCRDVTSGTKLLTCFIYGKIFIHLFSTSITRVEKGMGHIPSNRMRALLDLTVKNWEFLRTFFLSYLRSSKDWHIYLNKVHQKRCLCFSFSLIIYENWIKHGRQDSSLRASGLFLRIVRLRSSDTNRVPDPTHRFEY